MQLLINSIRVKGSPNETNVKDEQNGEHFVGSGAVKG